MSAMDVLHLEHLAKSRRTAQLRKALRGLSVRQLEELPTAVLDQAAFGLSSGDLLDLDVADIVVRYPGDLESAEAEVTGPAQARAVLQSKDPIEVALRGGRFELEDGHHRLVAARMLGRRTLPAVIEIHDNPILALRGVTATTR